MSRVLSLAGFEVTLIGRFWVIPEGEYNLALFFCTPESSSDSNYCGHVEIVFWLIDYQGTGSLAKEKTN
jgi:hypothetical protein